MFSFYISDYPLVLLVPALFAGEMLSVYVSLSVDIEAHLYDRSAPVLAVKDYPSHSLGLLLPAAAHCETEALAVAV
jgi:hypothetical protein